MVSSLDASAVPARGFRGAEDTQRGVNTSQKVLSPRLPSLASIITSACRASRLCFYKWLMAVGLHAGGSRPDMAGKTETQGETQQARKHLGWHF